jgi:metal-dependent hydrolase (beta-lactamase superfamily II)
MPFINVVVLSHKHSQHIDTLKQEVTSLGSDKHALTTALDSERSSHEVSADPSLSWTCNTGQENKQLFLLQKQGLQAEIASIKVSPADGLHFTVNDAH